MFALPHDNALIRTALRLGQWFHRDALPLPVARPVSAPMVVARPALESVPYTRREDAVALLQERRKDANLRKRVEEFLGGNIPECVRGEGVHAVLFRHIFSPNYELLRFLDHVNTLRATPVLFEHPNDKFIALNKDKYTLARVYFYLNTTKQDGINTRSLKLIDFDAAEGLPLSQVKTLSGNSLVDFHHHLLQLYHPEAMSHIYDATEWLHHMGSRAEKYYMNFFALFITNAVLFDNFRTKDHEAVFTKNVVIPALNEVYKSVGTYPIICPLQDVADENNPKWWTYPHDRLEATQALLV